MKLFYLVSAIVVSVLILILSFAQYGASCSWYLLDTSASPVFVLIQMSALGGVVGGLLVLFWKMPAPSEEDEMGGPEDKTE